MASFERARAASSVRKKVTAWRAAGERIALVPTMGNLHGGHLSLVDRAREHADRVIVSVFVNPTQFAPQEDVDSYPRTPQQDAAVLAEQGRTDLLFEPTEQEIYPRGTEGIVTVGLPALANDLCGRSRPGHFNGVASVVLRLLNITEPDVLLMGQKDYQQMILVGRMIEDLHLDVQLVSVPTVREPDGLAMSSRNQYLTREQRQAAPRLYAILRELASELGAGGAHFEERRRAGLSALKAERFEPDYLELRDATDLSYADPADAARRRVLLAAARLGRARLIDNLLI